jgi:hypothetical protein
VAGRVSPWSAGLVLVSAACSLWAGCGATRSPCASESCPTATVCDLDGTCRPLPEPARAATFSESLGLYATGWSNPDDGAGASHGSSDRLSLGGDADAVIDLTFTIPARQRNVVEAVLVLFPYQHARAATEPATIAVSRMRPSETNGAPRRTPPLPIGRTLSARVERPTARQAVRLDVLDAARDVAGAPLSLRVRMARGGDDDPWLFASPDTLDVDRRPRLELLLR